MYGSNLTSPETERQVLFAAFAEKEYAKEVADLPADLFTDAFTAAVHAAIVGMKGEGVDLVSVNAALEQQGIRRTESLVDIATRRFVFRAALDRHIANLRELSVRRKLVMEAEKLAAQANETGNDIPSVRDAAITALRTIDTANAGGSVSAQEAILGFASFIDRVSKGDHSRNIYTGIHNFDRFLGGFTGSKLVIIAARPAIGKSAFALQIAHHAAETGKRVLFCSWEMGQDEIVARLVARKTGIPVDRIENAQFHEDEYAVLTDAYDAIHALPLNIMTLGSRVAHVRREAVRLMEAGGLDAIFVDYLQLMTAVATKENRASQVAEISRDLRLLSMELGVPVFALSQLNRDSTKEARKPNMSDARESGAIEQDANIFIILHEPERAHVPDDLQDIWDDCEESGKKLIQVIVDKNRQGRSGDSFVLFDSPTMTFREAV